MAELKMQVTARVSIQVDVVLDQPWGPEATVQSVYDQAARDGRDRLRSLLSSEEARGRNIEISGHPSVLLVFAKEQR